MMSCGAMGWMPPPKTGGMVDRYVLQCFTGDTMHTTDISERELQSFLNNPERRFAKAANLPRNCSKEMYCQVLSCYIYQKYVVWSGGPDSISGTGRFMRLPRSTIYYSQISAGNFLGMGPWSEKFVVAST